MRRAVFAMTVAATLAYTAAASAHIQVAPAVVAPDDAVKFTLLVPGERVQQTTRVELKMPAGSLPFSYEDTPGWTRRLVQAGNGGVDRIVWTGRLARDGFVEFSFLAATPPRPGRLVWRALQTYSDAKIIRWIGAPDSQQPAPITRVVHGTPRQNAGGESAAGTASSDGPAAGPAVSTTRPHSDWLARGLAIVAMLAAGAVAATRPRRRTRPS